MTDREQHVANPDRTQVNDEAELERSTADVGPDLEPERGPRHAPWRKVARAVREAIEEGR